LSRFDWFDKFKKFQTEGADIRKTIKIINILSRMNIGGPSVHVALLSRYLNDDPFESLIISGSLAEGEGDMSFLLDDFKGRHITIPSMKREISPLADVKSLFRLIHIFKQEKPVIVHTNLAKAGIVGRLAAVMTGVPIIIHTFHGHIFTGYFSKWRSVLFIWVEKILAVFSTKIIVISDQIRNEICNVYRVANNSKVVTIPLGFELDKFEPLTAYRGYYREMYSIALDAPVIGIVGRLTAIKNHRLFLQIAQLLLRKFPEVHFLIIGDGEKKVYLENLAVKMDIDRHVHFTGWVREQAKIYADLDLLLLTSLNEGTPVTVIEAMYYGIPVVSTRVGGVPDLIEDKKSGFLINTQNPADFVEPVETLLFSDSERTKISKEAKEFIVRYYSIQRLISDITDLYCELLSRKGISC